MTFTANPNKYFAPTYESETIFGNKLAEISAGIAVQIPLPALAGEQMPLCVIAAGLYQ